MVLIVSYIMVPIETPTYFVNDTEEAEATPLVSAKAQDCCLTLETPRGNHHYMEVSHATVVREPNGYSKNQRYPSI